MGRAGHMQPTEDERVLAALAHASIVANVATLAGMIATALIWTMQRDRSSYVRAHALQALVYQGVVVLISIFMLLFWGVCLALSLLPVALRPDLYRGSLPDSFWLGLLGVALPIGWGILATLYGLYGAFQVYRNRPFHYPLVGRLVRRQLAPIEPAAPPPSAPPDTDEPPFVSSEPASPAEQAPAADLPPEAPAPKRRGRRSPPEDEG